MFVNLKKDLPFWLMDKFTWFVMACNDPLMSFKLGGWLAELWTEGKACSLVHVWYATWAGRQTKSITCLASWFSSHYLSSYYWKFLNPCRNLTKRNVKSHPRIENGGLLCLKQTKRIKKRIYWSWMCYAITVGRHQLKHRAPKDHTVPIYFNMCISRVRL